MSTPQKSIEIKTQPALDLSADTLLVPIREGDRGKGGFLQDVDKLTHGAFQALSQSRTITGQSGELTWLPSTTPAFGRIAVVGIGSVDKGISGANAVREIFATLSRQLRSRDAKSVLIAMEPLTNAIGSAELATQTVTEALVLGLYRFDKHHTDKKDIPKYSLGQVTLALGGRRAARAIENAHAKGMAMGNATNFARDLANTPANLMTPTIIAEKARELAETKGFEIEILEKSDAQRLGMGSYLSVASGSHQPPKFIVMRYKNGGRKANVALVGKGITFDTGGISLKPPGGMEAMKYDMTGAATVIATIGAVAELGLEANVLAIAPCTENMPGGSATKPGDVVYAMDGQSIEVINTDAEGRLVLADGIAYARSLGKPSAIIDVATLTGAMGVALGDYRIGVFSNQDALFRQLQQASAKTNELLWRMPIDDYYGKQIKSDVADIKNTGGRLAGSITAAKFIEAFVGDVPWAHLDIAGVMAANSDRGIKVKGSNGTPVRSLVEFIAARG